MPEDLSALLDAALDRHAARDRTAIISGDHVVSYADLARNIRRRAAAAVEAGVGRGEPVAILAGKSVELVEAFFGLMAAGACPCVLEPWLSGDELRDRLTSVGIRRLIGSGQTRGAVGIKVHSLETFLGSPPDRGAGPAPRLDDSDRAMMLFTSGSTGRPKGVLLSHGNLIVNARGVIERTGLSPADRLLHIMPLHHTNGINNQLIAPLLAGSTIVLESRFRPGPAIEALRRHRPTLVTGVPTVYSRMLTQLGPREHFSGLRLLRCGSAPITLREHQRIEETFGVPLAVSYGLSEATCTSTMNPPDAVRHGTVGTALPGQEVHILTPAGRPAPPGDDGEICLSGPALMLGYLDPGSAGNPEEPAEAGPIRDGLLHTGDIGHLDTDGYLTITGRLKDVIIRGGENVFPAAIEHVLAGHPAVRECCAVGRPDADLGEVPVAFVTLHRGAAAAPTDDELREWASHRLSRIAVPARVDILPELPTNSVGKPDRAALRRHGRHR